MKPEDAKSLPKLIVFDLDGVLIDSEPLQQAAYIETFARYGVQLSQSDLLPWLGQRENEILVGLSTKLGLAVKLPSLIEQRKKCYISKIRSSGKPTPGALQAINTVLSRGIKCALASSSGRREVVAVLRTIGAADLFSLIITGDDVRFGKPNPEVYLKVLFQFGVSANESAAIEDSETGVCAARAAGLKVIAVPNALTANQDFTLADGIAADVMSAVSTLMGNSGGLER